MGVSGKRTTWTKRGSLEERGGRCRAPGLRQAREAAGVTQAELAEKTGYSTSLLNALEGGGGKTVHRMVVSRIAAVLGVDPALLRGEL